MGRDGTSDGIDGSVSEKHCRHASTCLPPYLDVTMSRSCGFLSWPQLIFVQGTAPPRQLPPPAPESFAAILSGKGGGIELSPGIASELYKKALVGEQLAVHASQHGSRIDARGGWYIRIAQVRRRCAVLSREGGA